MTEPARDFDMPAERNSGQAGGIPAGRVATVGTFDGVHAGHREVLQRLREYALRHDLEPIAITFDRHPLEVIHPGRAPKMLQTPDTRDRLIEAEGVRVVRIPFTADLCQLTASEWLRLLKEDYGVEAMILGYDNTFGCDGRELTAADYRRIGVDLGLNIEIEGKIEGKSSTLARRAVTEGRMEDAAEILGRPYRLEGIVEKGRQLGRTIGVPTANLRPDPRLLMPRSGVYAGATEYGKAVVNIGDNPTVGEGNPVTVEAHIIGYEGDLYGLPLRLDLMRRLRDEQKFPDLETLRNQISLDIANALR